MGKLRISAEINKPIAQVWEAYNDPKHITNWSFANDDWHCPSAENDLRTGGSFKSRMEAKDGSFGFDFGGIYDEVKPLELIKYHMGDGREVETTFKDLGNNATEVVQEFDAESQNPEEMQQQGWQAILNSFKNYTENKL
ncbi:SRPBCC family protein [Soonwooa sp.]|uniref:SRPBCC family protein n=1 Tax=Soonwooa sp. TaxID=1938592 RepID=UPI0026130688|nr:SRPBCC family protein [Soonwooa sp.]